MELLWEGVFHSHSQKLELHFPEIQFPSKNRKMYGLVLSGSEPSADLPRFWAFSPEFRCFLRPPDNNGLIEGKKFQQLLAFRSERIFFHLTTMIFIDFSINCKMRRGAFKIICKNHWMYTFFAFSYLLVGKKIMQCVWVIFGEVRSILPLVPGILPSMRMSLRNTRLCITAFLSPCSLPRFNKYRCQSTSWTYCMRIYLIKKVCSQFGFRTTSSSWRQFGEPCPFWAPLA